MLHNNKKKTGKQVLLGINLLRKKKTYVILPNSTYKRVILLTSHHNYLFKFEFQDKN